MFHTSFDSRIGPVEISASERGITNLSIGQRKDSQNGIGNEHTDLAKVELLSYLNGSLNRFSVQTDLTSANNFQAKVWELLTQIPYGETRSYKDLAISLGDKNLVRAVGAANGSNPIAIIVPCHRVIGSDGSLVGYAYGIELKQELLMLENPSCFGIQTKLDFSSV